MTTDLDDRIRASLRRRADGISVEVPDPTTVRAVVRPTRNRRLELIAVAAALVLFVAAGALVILTARHDRATPVVSGETEPPAPEVGPLGRIIEPGALVTMPAAWTLERFSFHSAAYLQKSQSPGALQGSPEGSLVPVVATNAVEYQFSDDGRTMQLDFYPLGVREPPITTPGLPLVGVRDTTGYVFDHGGGRYRVQWDEGGRTWEADGAGYASLDAFMATVGAIRWADEEDWAQDAPDGLAEAIVANPGGAVMWVRGALPQLTVAPSAGTSTSTTAPPDGTTSDIGPVLSDRRCAARAPDIVVYLPVDATDEEATSIATHLDEDPAVIGYEYHDQQDQYEDFSLTFSDSPEMLASVRPEDLPPSFTVYVSHGSREPTAHDLVALPGVRKVVVDPCSSGWTFAEP